MRITISRRDFFKGAAATAAIAGMPPAAKIIETVMSKPKVSLIDVNGDVLGSTMDIIETVVGDISTFEVGRFDVTRTGTAVIIELEYKGQTYGFSIFGHHNNVTIGNTASIEGLATWVW